jgi:hypothetical protein
MAIKGFFDRYIGKLDEKRDDGANGVLVEEQKDINGAEQKEVNGEEKTNGEANGEHVNGAAVPESKPQEPETTQKTVVPEVSKTAKVEVQEVGVVL